MPALKTAIKLAQAKAAVAAAVKMETGAVVAKGEVRSEVRAVAATFNPRLSRSEGSSALRFAGDVEGGVETPSKMIHLCGESCDVAYHAHRAIEERDRAMVSGDSCSRLVHEALAELHSNAAAQLRRKVRVMIAPCVD